MDKSTDRESMKLMALIQIHSHFYFQILYTLTITNLIHFFYSNQFKKKKLKFNMYH